MTPTVPYGITNEDREMFMRQMVVSTLGPQGSGGKASPAVCSPTASTCTTNSVASSSSSGGTANAALSSGTGTIGTGIAASLYVPPLYSASCCQSVASTPAPTLVNLSFSQSLSNIAGSLSASGANAQRQPSTSTLFTFSTGGSPEYYASKYCLGGQHHLEHREFLYLLEQCEQLCK